MNDVVRILGFGGSLREESFNQTLLETSCLLQASSDICPDDMSLEIYDKIGDFPLYNQELEQEMPSAVKDFKQKIQSAGAILIVTPEYNYAIPGFLKNVLDWASRPAGDNSLDDKPGAIMSASPGMFGGARAQYILRQVCVSLNVHLLNKPEVMVSSVHEKMDNGKLADEPTLERISELMRALGVWTRRLRGTG